MKRDRSSRIALEHPDADAAALGTKQDVGCLRWKFGQLVLEGHTMNAAEINTRVSSGCLSKWRDLLGSSQTPIERVAGMILSCTEAERHGRACSCQRVFFPRLVEAAAHPC